MKTETATCPRSKWYGEIGKILRIEGWQLRCEGDKWDIANALIEREIIDAEPEQADPKFRLYYIILSPSGEPFPHSFAIHRSRCIKRFLLDPAYGHKGEWRQWRRKGYRLVKSKLEIQK